MIMFGTKDVSPYYVDLLKGRLVSSTNKVCQQNYVPMFKDRIVIY